MSLRRTVAGYDRLNQQDDADLKRNATEEREEVDGIIDEQFMYKPKRTVPWKTLFFIAIFMIAGVICLTCCILISTGYFDKSYADRLWPLLILGILMFIPGGYYAYILLCICFKRDGFTLEDIPVL